MKDAKRAAIAETSLFRGCSTDDVAWLARVSDMLDVGAGSTLAIEGRKVREFIVIVEGVASGDGVLYGPGSCIGGVELLDGSPYGPTIETLSDARILVFGPREFRGLLTRVPSIAKTLLRDLSGRLRVQDERNLRAVS